MEIIFTQRRIFTRIYERERVCFFQRRAIRVENLGSVHRQRAGISGKFNAAVSLDNRSKMNNYRPTSPDTITL